MRWWLDGNYRLMIYLVVCLWREEWFYLPQQSSRKVWEDVLCNGEQYLVSAGCHWYYKAVHHYYSGHLLLKHAHTFHTQHLANLGNPLIIRPTSRGLSPNLILLVSTELSSTIIKLQPTLSSSPWFYVAIVVSNWQDCIESKREEGGTIAL